MYVYGELCICMNEVYMPGEEVFRKSSASYRVYVFEVYVILEDYFDFRFMAGLPWS